MERNLFEVSFKDARECMYTRTSSVLAKYFHFSIHRLNTLIIKVSPN